MNHCKNRTYQSQDDKLLMHSKDFPESFCCYLMEQYRIHKKSAIIMENFYEPVKPGLRMALPLVCTYLVSSHRHIPYDFDFLKVYENPYIHQKKK